MGFSLENHDKLHDDYRGKVKLNPESLLPGTSVRVCEIEKADFVEQEFFGLFSRVWVCGSAGHSYGYYVDNNGEYIPHTAWFMGGRKRSKFEYLFQKLDHERQNLSSTYQSIEAIESALIEGNYYD
jgi:hypothetical protein